MVFFLYSFEMAHFQYATIFKQKIEIFIFSLNPNRMNKQSKRHSFQLISFTYASEINSSSEKEHFFTFAKAIHANHFSLFFHAKNNRLPVRQKQRQKSSKTENQAENSCIRGNRKNQFGLLPINLPSQFFLACHLLLPLYFGSNEYFGKSYLLHFALVFSLCVYL